MKLRISPIKWIHRAKHLKDTSDSASIKFNEIKNQIKQEENEIDRLKNETRSILNEIGEHMNTNLPCRTELNRLHCQSQKIAKN